MKQLKAWEALYRRNEHLSVWPWSDLVSHVMHHARPKRGTRVLELGCGAGANIPFFLRLEADYHAIEGSPTMAKRLHARFPELEKKIVAGDFTKNLAFDGRFDLIVDRASLTSNTTAAIERCLALVRTKLKPGGIFIGIDWYSTLCPEFASAKALDSHTRQDFKTGPFAGLGTMHFSDEAHLRGLFRRFSLVALEHKTLDKTVPAGPRFATWNLVARRPK